MARRKAVAKIMANSRKGARAWDVYAHVLGSASWKLWGCGLLSVGLALSETMG